MAIVSAKSMLEFVDMLHQLAIALCLLCVASFSSVSESAVPGGVAQTSSCVQCHANKQQGFAAAHSFAAEDCAACHAGNADALNEELAHAGLIAFPGNLANADQACGGCHADRVLGVTNNLMHTGHGIVRITRDVLDDGGDSGRAANFQSLEHSVADSMLRKQCASCHLGQPKTKHQLDVTFDRGGGCLACHVNGHPEQAHPALTTRVEDGRCFGCHSRSGRISLSYTGLAEVDTPTVGDEAILKLADGRTVERLPADVHYLAGMSCIDCHTSVSLMGDAGSANHQRQAVDIQCIDCHANDSVRTTLTEWPASIGGMQKHVPFDTGAETRFLTTEKHGTPLWHIELFDDDALLHTKNSRRQLRISTPDPARIGHDDKHQRLTCAACHSQWVPQCFGCHMEYDADGEQWDHIEKRNTEGRWSDKRWHVNNALPALGVNEDDQVEPFVPGMIMTVAHPEYDENKFVRQFASLSPHTIGKARSCESCHRSSNALGLGEGEFTGSGGHLSFAPRHGLLQDGLPADAWTNSDNSLGGRTPVSGQRPFTAGEMKKILEAEISRREPGARQ